VWFRGALVNWDALGAAGVRDTLSNHDFGSASFALKDSNFKKQIDYARNGGAPGFDSGVDALRRGVCDYGAFVSSTSPIVSTTVLFFFFFSLHVFFEQDGPLFQDKRVIPFFLSLISSVSMSVSLPKCAVPLEQIRFSIASTYAHTYEYTDLYICAKNELF